MFNSYSSTRTNFLDLWRGWREVNYTSTWERKLPSLKEIRYYVEGRGSWQLHELTCPGAYIRRRLEDGVKIGEPAPDQNDLPPMDLPPIFFIPTKEFVKELAYDLTAYSIGRTKVKTVVEVCAGHGLLGFSMKPILKRMGIQVIVTDAQPSEEENYHYFSEFPSEVEKLTVQEALDKYQPEITISAWTPLGSKATMACVEHPTVRAHYEIGEGPCGCTAHDELWASYNYKEVRRLGELSAGRTDMHHNNVFTFYGKGWPYGYGKYKIPVDEDGVPRFYERGKLIEGVELKND